MPRRYGALLALGVALAAVPAFAQSQQEVAKSAYDRGLAAHKRGDFAKAAQEFAAADEASPSAVALGAAIDAALLADDPVLGSELVARSERGPLEGQLKSVVPKARERFAGRAGRVRLVCPASSKCLGSLDGAPLARDKATWVKVGQHTVVYQVDDATQQRLVEVRASEVLDLTPAPVAAPPSSASVSPAPPASAARAPGPSASAPPTPSASASAERPHHTEPVDLRPPRSGLSPVVFWIGAGATVLLAGGATVAAVRTQSLHSRFDEDRCAQPGRPESCSSLGRDGATTQNVANGLFVLTGVAGVATAVLGIAFTNWGGDSGPRAAVVPGGAVAGYSGKF